ncbi:MAG: hypothetical protein Q8L10_03650 [Candidatus Moranbacteria bacterium]|nr:hypothetical protein [Candidatus Moranbacteria bacterium]
MKKLAIAILSVLLVSATAYSASWEILGDQGFNDHYSTKHKIAVHPKTQEVYVAFKDFNHSNKATVKKFNGSSWEVVGTTGFSIGEIGNGRIGFTFNPLTNEPYLAYEDWSNSNRISVMRFNGSSWTSVGIPGFSKGRVTDISIAFNPKTNEPYVAYESGTKITVMKFDGQSWINVGNPEFGGAANEFVSGVDIAFDASEPYVTYSIHSSGRILVVKLHANSWIDFGNTGANYVNVFTPSILFQPTTNVPYVIYGYDGGIEVIKFNGEWKSVGKEISNTHSWLDMSMGFNPKTQEPYVAFQDYSKYFKLTVKKFNGKYWSPIDLPGFSSGAVSDIAMTFDKNGIAYITFHDHSLDKSIVIKLNP